MADLSSLAGQDVPSSDQLVEQACSPSAGVYVYGDSPGVAKSVRPYSDVRQGCCPVVDCTESRPVEQRRSLLALLYRLAGRPFPANR